MNCNYGYLGDPHDEYMKSVSGQVTQSADIPWYERLFKAWLESNPTPAPTPGGPVYNPPAANATPWGPIAIGAAALVGVFLIAKS